MIGPLLCPKCKSAEATPLQEIVQPWKLGPFLFHVRLGRVYGCTDCAVTIKRYNDGTYKLLGEKREMKREVDPKLEAALKNRVADPDMNWGET